MGELGALNPLEGPQNIYKCASAHMPPRFHLYSYWKPGFQLQARVYEQSGKQCGS